MIIGIVLELNLINISLFKGDLMPNLLGIKCCHVSIRAAVRVEMLG